MIGICLEYGLSYRQDMGTEQSASLSTTAPKQLSWPYAQNSGVQVQFDDKLSALYFEVNDKSRPRAWFFNNQAIPAGTHTFTFVYRLPSGNKLFPDDLYSARDGTWLKNALAYNGSPVDVGFLNHTPAGAKGFVKRVGDSLQFEDGTPVRFWGTNITAYALFNNSLAAKQMTASRLRKLGYNLVRLHHHDSSWVTPNIFDGKATNSLTLYANSLKQIDEWVSALKAEGIYVWMDFHVGWRLKPGDQTTDCGTISTWNELSKYQFNINGFVQYDPVLQCLFKKLMSLYLDRTNEVTGVRYKDEPAIVGLLVTNEDRIVDQLGHLPLADKGNPVLRAMFQEKTSAFASRTGLPLSSVEATWIPGPSKYFLTEQERSFLTLAVDHLRAIGFKTLITTGHQWGNPQFALPGMLQSDFTDVHSYGGAESLSSHPSYAANFVEYIGSQQLVDRPLSVTEYNTEYPTIDRFTTPLYVASVGALQGWDAPMIYAYTQSGGLDSPPSGVDVWGTGPDPAITGLMPAAALMFRRGDVSPAKNKYVVKLTPSYSFEKGDGTWRAGRELIEQSKYSVTFETTPHLPWFSPPAPPPGTTAVTNPDASRIASDSTAVESDTGELRRDWRQGVQTINTPRFQAAQGFIGGRTLSTADLQLSVAGPKKATVAVASLDGRPIAGSYKLFVTFMAQAAWDGATRAWYSEPVEGALTLAAPPGLKISVLKGDGSVLKELTPSYSGGRYSVTLARDLGSHWLLFEGTAPPTAPEPPSNLRIVQ